MGNTTHKAPPWRHETSTWDPTNPCQLQNTKWAYISKETKNGTTTIKWHYRVTIESSSGENSSVESRHPLDLLRTLANNLEAKSKGLQLVHRHSGVGVQAQEIMSEPDLVHVLHQHHGPLIEDHNTTTFVYLQQQQSPDPSRSSKWSIFMLQREVDHLPWHVPGKIDQD